jgi:hypothetical protein
MGITNAKPVLATETVVVWDDDMKINRKVFAGQNVPPDLVPAYREATGKDTSSDEPVDYESWTSEALAEEAARRGLTVEGTGANGNVVKADNIAALEAADEASS